MKNVDIIRCTSIHIQKDSYYSNFSNQIRDDKNILKNQVISKKKNLITENNTKSTLSIRSLVGTNQCRPPKLEERCTEIQLFNAIERSIQV